MLFYKIMWVAVGLPHPPAERGPEVKLGADDVFKRFFPLYHETMVRLSQNQP
jgi:hypothetical protein